MSLYREQLNTWLKQIDVKADRVIDVGGGDKPIKNDVRSWDVKEYHIMDNDAQFEPDFFIDFNNQIEKKLCGKYDVVFCLELMEYIYDPVTSHKNIRLLLKDGGIAYISYPTIYPLHNPPDIDYLRYSKNAIEKLLTVAGFKTWEITPRVATEGVKYLSDFYRVEGMRAMKNTSQIFDIGYMCKVFV